MNLLDPLTLKIRLARLRQRLFGRPVDVRASWASTPSDYKDLVAFLDWFDRAGSVEEAVERGRIDWEYRFANGAHFAHVPKGTALEIGFGGGRLLIHAARSFASAIGVDIHENFAMTRQFLASQGVANVQLLHRDQLASVPDGSVDFVYSFIVFQHFDGMDEVNFYLDHVSRVLSPDGIAQIYYGKKAGEGVSVTGADTFRLRDCSLFIAPETMREIVAGRFDLLEYRDSLPRDAKAGTGESVQAQVTFRDRRAAAQREAADPP